LQDAAAYAADTDVETGSPLTTDVASTVTDPAGTLARRVVYACVALLPVVVNAPVFVWVAGHPPNAWIAPGRHTRLESLRLAAQQAVVVIYGVVC